MEKERKGWWGEGGTRVWRWSICWWLLTDWEEEEEENLPHLGSLHDCLGISSGTAAPCRRVFCMFAQQLLVLFRAFSSCSLFNMAEECHTCWAQVQFLKLWKTVTAPLIAVADVGFQPCSLLMLWQDWAHQFHHCEFWFEAVPNPAWLLPAMF